MKGKQLLIAVIVLVVLGALALFTSGGNQDGQSSGQSGIGSEVVTKLDPSKVTSVVITDKDGTVTLQQKDEQWSIAERDGFAAKFEDIKKLVTGSVTLKSLRTIRASKSQRGRFELIDPVVEKENSGIKIEFKGAEGAELKTILLGKKTGSQPGANPGSPFGSNDNQRSYWSTAKSTQSRSTFQPAHRHRGRSQRVASKR